MLRSWKPYVTLALRAPDPTEPDYLPFAVAMTVVNARAAYALRDDRGREVWGRFPRVYFEYVAWPLFLVGAALFLIGSLVDILDGALARAHDLGTPFGAFLDSTLDRVGEAFMLGAIALVLMRDGSEWGVALAFAAMAGSFLVSYTRARAEAVDVKGDVGFGSRAERVTVICLGLAFAPLGALPYAMAVLTAMAWGTVLQRILHVKKELQA